MKPFTLEWWLDKLAAAIELKCISGVMTDEERKLHNSDYYKLEVWIERRIVRKYGERPEDSWKETLINDLYRMERIHPFDQLHFVVARIRRHGTSNEEWRNGVEIFSWKFDITGTNLREFVGYMASTDCSEIMVHRFGREKYKPFVEWFKSVKRYLEERQE